MLDWMTRGLFLAQADGAGDEGATGVEVTAPDGGEAAITVEGGDVDVTVEGGGAEDAPPITLEAVQQDAMNAWEGLMAMESMALDSAKCPGVMSSCSKSLASVMGRSCQFCISARLCWLAVTVSAPIRNAGRACLGEAN